VADPWRNRALAPLYALAITFVLVSAARGALGEPAPATDVQVCVAPGSKIDGAKLDPATGLSCRRYPTGEQPVTILPIADPPQKPEPPHEGLTVAPTAPPRHGKSAGGN
jgi:hypothetical protein